MNQQPISKELITLSKSGHELIVLRCMTTNKGYSIFCQSRILHALFKKHSNGRIANSSVWGSAIGGKKMSGYDTNVFMSDNVFDSNKQSLASQLRRSLQNWGNAKLILEENYDEGSGLVGGIPNLSFLTCDTLHEGISLEISTPISQTAVDLFIDKSEILLKYLFNQFCANKSRELRMTVESEEEQITDFEGVIELVPNEYDWTEVVEKPEEEVQTL